jgi:hypothetical protein
LILLNGERDQSKPDKGVPTRIGICIAEPVLSEDAFFICLFDFGVLQ